MQTTCADRHSNLCCDKTNVIEPFEFSMFPVEILEIFFKHSDGQDIINCRLVCKRWYNIISRLTKDTNLWQVKCENEIPVHFQRSILEKLHPSISLHDFQEENDNLRWLSMYQTWVKWRRIKHFNAINKQFEPFFLRLPTVHITCVTVSENLIAVGSSDGFIAFYDIENSTMEPIFIADQMEYVSDVQFIRNDNEVKAISSSGMHRILLWDVREKRAMDIRHYGRLICTTPGYVWIAQRNKLNVQGKDMKKSYKFSEVCGSVVALMADGEQASLWTDLGYNYRVHLSIPNTRYIVQQVSRPEKAVRQYYLFKPWIAVCITIDGHLGISVNGRPWVMYNILSKLHGEPTAVLFYANVLVLGLDSGSVHMYYVNSVKSLAAWDFRSSNSKSIIVDNQAVISLDIMDRPNQQYLIAATAEKVHVIELKDSI